MQYLKIHNAGSMDRRYLFLVGGSKKRGRADDLRTTGFKGTGLKLAMIGALRLNLKMFVTSSDDCGPYMMTPFARRTQVDGQDFSQLCHRYYRVLPAETFNWFWKIFKKSASERMMVEREKETEFLLESFADFTEAIGADDKPSFKTIREPICNAYDEDEKFTLSYVEASEVVPAGDNETVVYLQCTPEMLAIFSTEQICRYFKLFPNCPKPIWGHPEIGWLYPKSDPMMTRLFVRGVLAGVNNNTEQTSCFDYSLLDQQLVSEDKVIKDEEVYRYRAGGLITMVNSMELAATILDAVCTGQGNFENQAVLWNDYSSAPSEAVRVAYYGAWHHLFGPYAILPLGKAEIDHRAEQSGYHLKHFPLSANFRRFLLACGIRTSDDVVPKQGQMDFLPADESELSQIQLAVYHLARELLYKYFPQAKKYPIRLLKSKSGGNVVNTCGVAGEKETIFKEIYLNIAHPFFNTLRTLLHTMIHEYHHCESKATDFTHNFVESTVNGEVDLIFRNENIK